MLLEVRFQYFARRFFGEQGTFGAMFRHIRYQRDVAHTIALSLKPKVFSVDKLHLSLLVLFPSRASACWNGFGFQLQPNSDAKWVAVSMVNPSMCTVWMGLNPLRV